MKDRTVALLVALAVLAAVVAGEESEGDAPVEADPTAGRPTAFVPRRVDLLELKDRRSEVEDRLRYGLLSVVGDRATRDVLNQPWNVAGMKHCGEMLLRDAIADKYGVVGIDFPLWERVTKMLAYVHKTYTNDSALVLNGVEQFENFYKAALAAPRGYPQAYTLSALVHALEEYGSTDLLTPTFWKCAECEDFEFPRNIAVLGNHDALTNLKKLLQEATSTVRRETLTEAIETLSQRLSRKGESNGK